MWQKFSLLLMSVPLTLYGTLPAQAQGFTAPCTEAQEDEARDLLITLNDNLLELSLPDEDPDNADQFFSQMNTLIIQIDDLLADYYENMAPQFGDCAAAVYSRDYIGILYLNLLDSFVGLTLGGFSLFYGDETLGNRLMDESQAYLDDLTEMPEVPELVALMDDDALLPEGLLMCGTEAAAAELAKYEEGVAEYQALKAAYADFVQTVSGDFDELYRFHILARNIVKIEDQLCAETYITTTGYRRLFVETDLTINLLQVAAFTKVYGGVSTADSLQGIAERHAKSVERFQGSLFAKLLALVFRRSPV